MRACSKWRLFTTHLGTNHPSKWRNHHHSFISFLYLKFSFLSSSNTPFFIIPLYVLVFFIYYSIIILFFKFCKSSSSSLYNCVFSFCSLEENLHTYLTTWLSSCPVTIFFELITIFVNPKIINKSETSKMCNPKTNSHHIVLVKVNFCDLMHDKDKSRQLIPNYK